MSDPEPRFSLRQLRHRLSSAARNAREPGQASGPGDVSDEPKAPLPPANPVAVNPDDARPHPRAEADATPAFELPELCQSVLDEPTLDALFRDVARHTRLLEVIPKTTRHRFVEAGRVSLDEGRRMLADGTVRALQLRYLHDGAEWWDTLIRSAEGVRIVRIRHEFARGEARSPSS